MSSQITIIRDALVTALDTLMPSGSGWSRLPNPYKPEENPEQFLRQGWGLAVGPATNTDRLVNCKYSLARTFTVVLSRKYDALENDASAKADTELALLEDLHEVIKKLSTDVSVNGEDQSATYVTDGGVEYVQQDSDRFLMVRAEISLEYFEEYA